MNPIKRFLGYWGYRAWHSDRKALFVHLTAHPEDIVSERATVDDFSDWVGKQPRSFSWWWKITKNPTEHDKNVQESWYQMFWKGPRL